jgi:hypothetical protein
LVSFPLFLEPFQPQDTRKIGHHTMVQLLSVPYWIYLILSSIFRHISLPYHLHLALALPRLLCFFLVRETSST